MAFISACSILIVGTVVVCIPVKVNTSTVLPRGVSRAKGSLYRAGEPFTCLDGRLTIPFQHINDDYCDCADGSDEPGTSACPNGKFFCINKGYKSESIPSSRVSDGYCDCCDGSDEYEGKIKCGNNCIELGRAMREERERLSQHVVEGHRIRSEYSVHGKKAKEEQQALLVELGPQRDKLLLRRDELETKKKEVEAPEKEAKDKHDARVKEEQALKDAEKDKLRAVDAFTDLDSDSDGRLTVTELTGRVDLDKDSDGTLSEEEAKGYLVGLDSVDIATFISTCWPLMKEKYKASSTPAPEHIDPAPKEEPAEADDQQADSEDDDSDFEEDDFDSNEVSSKPAHVDSISAYPEEIRRLIEVADEVREQYKAAEKEYTDINNRIEDIEKFLALDLGPGDVFYPLKGECYEFTDREYIYKLCPFDKASQRPKGGGSETNLGHFTKWVSSDEEQYAFMKFENGLGCWNGPNRSATVKFICGRENQLSNAAEPNRCEYSFDFTTPAACHRLPEPASETHDHDEL